MMIVMRITSVSSALANRFNEYFSTLGFSFYVFALSCEVEGYVNRFMFAKAFWLNGKSGSAPQSTGQSRFLLF